MADKPNDKKDGANSASLAIIGQMIKKMGDDPTRPGLIDTPARVLRAWEELFIGYRQNPEYILRSNFIEDGRGYNEMILLSDIDFTSFCEHHLMPFEGVAHVAYIPNQHIVGVSKLARLVDVYARRLQIQERMTMQIADALQKYVSPRGIGVVVQARHGCLSCRGTQKKSALMTTSRLLGVFREDPATRSEFLSSI